MDYRLIFAVSAAVFLGLYNVFIKVSAGHIHQIAGAVILQVVAVALGASALLYLKATGTTVPVSQKGIIFAVLAGLSVGLAEILSFYLFSKNSEASKGIPFIVGGSVVVAALAGIFFLKESVTPQKIIAITLITAGTVLLALK